MIISFSDKATEDIFNGTSSKASRKFPQNIWKIAFRKLDLLNAAHELKDLLTPPGNKLEALRGDLSGYYSIRINDQFRIIFVWENGNAVNVKVTDYH
jgi:toxin HigB-1